MASNVFKTYIRVSWTDTDAAQVVHFSNYFRFFEKAEEFYSVHKNKPFFSELVSFISSSRVVACILEGENAINTVRILIGSTRSFDAQPGTIRGDYGLGITNNIIHASDSYESFIKESKVIFK